MTACPPERRVLSIQPAIAASQGRRSSSVSGMPRRILSTLAAGWNQSASSNSHRRRDASSAPTVDLPDPDTPMTITTATAEDAALSLDRFSMNYEPLPAAAAPRPQPTENALPAVFGPLITWLSGLFAIWRQARICRGCHPGGWSG